MKDIPSYLPPCVLAGALFMFYLGISGLQTGDWPWTLLGVFAGGLLVAGSFVAYIIKSFHAIWLVFSGILLALPYFLPVYIKVWLSVIAGQKEYLFTAVILSVAILLFTFIGFSSLRLMTLHDEK